MPALRAGIYPPVRMAKVLQQRLQNSRMACQTKQAEAPALVIGAPSLLQLGASVLKSAIYITDMYACNLQDLRLLNLQPENMRSIMEFIIPRGSTARTFITSSHRWRKHPALKPTNTRTRCLWDPAPQTLFVSLTETR